MIRDIFYIVFGYILGSVLFARLFGSLLCNADITEDTADKNPGTANAFRNGGFLCGTLTLLGDLLKGFLPVFLYLRGTPTAALALVIAAPVVGHVFSVFHVFRGGKGIATTFGCLLGLLPNIIPALSLAFFFIFFSVVLRISPHFYRTLFTYFFAEIALFFLADNMYIIVGFSIIFIVVTIRMLTSREDKKTFEVGLLWMR